MPSPFDRKGSGGSSAAAAPAAKAPASKADAADPMQASNPDGSKPPSVAKKVGGDPFSASAPRGISGVKVQYFITQLILVHPIEHGTMKTTVNNPEKPVSEYVRCDITPLTTPDDWAITNNEGEREEFDEYVAGDEITGILVFNQALVREFKDKLDSGGGYLLGRLQFGQKKPGQNKPYILVEGSEDDFAIYENWCVAEKARRAAAAKG